VDCNYYWGCCYCWIDYFFEITMKELVIRIREQDFKGKDSFEYKNKIILSNFQQLALILSDLEKYGANIEKAFRKFIENKESDKFPF